MSSRLLINEDYMDESHFDSFLYILTQTHIETDILKYNDGKEIGIACACTGEEDCHQPVYSCLIAVADKAPARDIKERVPVYQDFLGPYESCSSKCAYFDLNPKISDMFYTDEQDCLEGQYMDKSGFCRHCHELVPGATSCNAETVFVCQAELADGTLYEYDPYFISGGRQSCEIVGCTQVAEDDDHFCIACESGRHDQFFYWSKYDGKCTNDCAMIPGGNYKSVFGVSQC